MNTLRKLLAALIMLLFAVTANMSIFSCNPKPGSEDNQDSTKKFSEQTLGINIRLPLKTDPGKFIDSVDVYFNLGGNLKNFVSTCPCAPGLLNINYPDLEIDGQQKLQVKNSSRPQGLQLPPQAIAFRNPVFTSDQLTSVDYESSVKFLSSFETLPYNLTKDDGTNPPAEKTDIVKVAIFDSGFKKNPNPATVNPRISISVSTNCYETGEKPYQSGVSSLKASETQMIQGLNFAPEGQIRNRLNYSIDDNESLHGTRVAYLIAKEFENSAKGVQFIFMKVLNKENKGDSFGIMCAMIHARKLGADIFNMSLGYYGTEPDPLFQQCLVATTQAAMQKPIPVITAAGNAMPGNGPGFESNPTNFALPKYRDIDRRTDLKFYPAYFSNPFFNMGHVFSVTTLNDNLDGVCEGMNYGKETVDFGVLGENCGFPDLIKNTPAFGTSFATPVVTGWLGSSVDLTLSRQQVFALARKKDELTEYLKDGSYILRSGQNQ